MIPIFSKIVSSFRRKGYATGGLELLARLVAPEISKTGRLETYRKSLYVFACVSKIAEKVASVELKMYRVLNSKGDVKEVETHPVLDLLSGFNPFQTKSEFIEQHTINQKCSGDSFWYKVRNKSGKVVELWNLRPDCVTIVADPEKFIKGYKFDRADGQTIFIEPENIVHHKYTDPLSSYFGMSPITPAAKRVQSEEYATTFQRDFFLNSARPDAVLKNSGQDLTAEQKKEIKQEWKKSHQGVGNSSKIAVLEGGVEYQQISISQKEMDYIESIKATRDDILVAFKVPKPLLAIVDDVNRANSETAMEVFLRETIKPEMVRLCEKINEKLVWPDFGEEFFIDFVDPTPQNVEQNILRYQSGIQNGYMLINEVRQELNMPPIKGGWSLYRPIMEQAVGGLPQNDGKGIKLIMGEAAKMTKSQVYEQAAKPKVYDFKGRYWYKRKLELREAIEKSISKGLKDIKKKKEEKKPRPLITDADLKLAYANLVNKKIDARAKTLSDGVIVFAENQKKRVLAKIDKLKSKKKITVKVEQVFDKDAENEIAIEFITPYLAQFLKDAAVEALDLVAPAEDFTDKASVAKLIKKRAEFFADSVNSTTLDGLESTLGEGIAEGEGIAQLSDRVSAVYDEFPTWRSDLIARTEATAANGEGTIEGLKQSGVANAKEWINAGDARVREEHMDQPVGVGGEIVGLDEIFTNGLKYPSEPNCRCVLGPAFIE